MVLPFTLLGAYIGAYDPGMQAEYPLAKTMMQSMPLFIVVELFYLGLLFCLGVFLPRFLAGGDAKGLWSSHGNPDPNGAFGNYSHWQAVCRVFFCHLGRDCVRLCGMANAIHFLFHVTARRGGYWDRSQNHFVIRTIRHERCPLIMTRALITGCTGCLGSNLAAELIQKGIEVVGLSYKNESRIALKGLDVELIEGNVLEFEANSAMRGVDWVFHVAGIADDWNYSAERVYETNVMGTFNVLSAARVANVKRFVLTSSAAVTGVPPQPDGRPMNESDMFNLAPRDWIYGYSKVLAEQILSGLLPRGCMRSALNQPH